MSLACCGAEGKRQGPACDVHTGRDADILEDIALPGVAAVIWQRQLCPHFLASITAVPAASLPRMRLTVPIVQVETAVKQAAAAADLQSKAVFDYLARDIAHLARHLGKVHGARAVKLRLEVAEEVTCPKFHLDQVEVRLLCSYRGPGTEYVKAEAVGDPRRIRRVATGAAGLFRGAKWSSREPCGLLHRSPGAGPGEDCRLLLVLDPA